MMYALQVRNHEKQRWERAACDVLFESQLQAFHWLCAQPASTRPDTSWGWRVREATKAEERKPHKIPINGSSSAMTEMREIAALAGCAVGLPG